MLKWCHALYWIALTIWVSVVISAGIAAMSAFTVLPDVELGVCLEAFAQYDEQQHGRIAAGHVMEPIFTFVDVVSIVAAVLVLAMVVMQFAVFRMSWRSPANVIRILAIVAAVVLLVWRAAALTPEMNRDLRAYWDAARVGDVAAADQHLVSFNVNHRRARPMLDATLVLLLIAVGASGIAMTLPRNEKRSNQLEPPTLTRKT